MRGLKSRITRVLPIGTRLNVADNSGARIVQIISVKKKGGVKKRLLSAGVGDMIIGAVKVGKPDMKHKVIPCVVIRQRKEFRRQDGSRVKFSDNACIVLKDVKEGDPKGTTIKGPVAREVVKRFPLIGKISSMVV